jgi:hypothetical protein
MSDKRQRLKGRKTSGSFMQIPHAVIEHENYSRLSHRACRLLWDLYSQFRGKNNGDLCASMSIMKRKGWKSNDQLSKAKKELLETGWIVRTKVGGLGIGPDLFAVTFKPIDECGGKLDCKETSVALGYWKLGYNREINPPHRIQVQSAPPHGTGTKLIA